MGGARPAELGPGERRRADRTLLPGSGLPAAAGRPRSRAPTSASAGRRCSTAGVSLRFRERDFEVDREIVGDSGARWPLRYADLEPYYAEAERILGVVRRGRRGSHRADARSAVSPSRRGSRAGLPAARGRPRATLGLRPFRLPLAINRTASDGRGACQSCGTCDGFACAVGAKNDLATTVIGPLLAAGAPAGDRRRRHPAPDRRRAGDRRGDGDRGRRRARAVHRARRSSSPRARSRTPQLLLASGLARLNPAGG